MELSMARTEGGTQKRGETIIPTLLSMLAESVRLSDRYRLLFSVGRSLKKGPRFLAYLGVQVLLKNIGKRQGAEQRDSEKKWR